MSKIEDGGAAFPTTVYYDEKPYGIEDGMSLRDYFAAKAMHAEIVSSCSDLTPEAATALVRASVAAGHSPEEHIALNAYKMADAMIKARKAK